VDFLAGHEQHAQVRRSASCRPPILRITTAETSRLIASGCCSELSSARTSTAQSPHVPKSTPRTARRYPLRLEGTDKQKGMQRCSRPGTGAMWRSSTYMVSLFRPEGSKKLCLLRCRQKARLQIVTGAAAGCVQRQLSGVSMRACSVRYAKSRYEDSACRWTRSGDRRGVVGRFIWCGLVWDRTALSYGS
jgi:hypothetical protein